MSFKVEYSDIAVTGQSGVVAKFLLSSRTVLDFHST